ncbi:MAG TPA: hypothetical protein VLX61_03035 [Anaerolineales bacterium]|nr:hypothetical protein [Anaerolineales bacterium]
MDDQKLMNYFKFDAVDLQANRNGQVTDKQKARMLKEAKSGGILGNPFALLLIFIGLIGFVIAIAAGISVPDWTFRIGFGLGFGCIWPLAWGGIGVRSLLSSSSSSPHQFTVARVQGMAGIESRQIYDGSMEHTLHIGNKRFEAERGLDQVLTPGAQYIIYYYIRDDLDALVSTKNILSAEII